MVAPLEAVELSHPGGPIRLAQVTDTHLGEEPGTRLLDLDTDFSLQAVLAQLRAEQEDLRLLLATGDLSDQGSAASYERLVEYLAPFGLPTFALPGNHDQREVLAAACRGQFQLVPLVRIGAWQLVLLDSQVPGEVGGELGAGQLALLETALEEGEARGLHTLVCLHHQPVQVGCAWLDEQMVADADALFALLERFAGVRGLLWGHVHQELNQMRGPLRLLCTPSTCVQFAPGSERFRADDQAPGYRWLELHPDGRIDSGVSRVSGIDFDVDLDSGGYL